MRNKLIYFFSLITFVACTLEGVDEDENNHDNDQITVNEVDSTDNSDEQQSSMLKADSINGVANEMVFQREDGLRIEWEIKKTERPIDLNDVVLVNYKARVAAGEQFDSNSELGEPVPLKSNIGVMLPGWEQGLVEMSEGDIGRIMIPAALAYGEDGYKTIVPPKADIIVDIEIVEKVEPIVLEDGVKVYKYKKVIDGAIPKKEQKITFDYFAFRKGKDPGMYDNSYQNATPFSFKFENDNVVEGLHIGMSVMKAGESAFIEIPAKVAYGKKGLIDHVPANTDIVYDVRVSTIE
ncbi:FKBP-type peptidyl-prolyl cis-trans isomerase [Paracrocinitomix mangrovi]|uniref:FKBP-type peptidyl-prolyl cis-trans isomerase n=1 Tax=Paracrocinitomix mangrovi TaxID=2862509 RepID=UPI001C8DE238|nr:FKBP-type peptidyl-prolyl cis-trans isomerase [Paracrocinitomix mangrovi]UKN01886.1 FKBP-type peptidyl-prolyl cis-trans isomerase [Paracrocinitomix mangrovi]